MRFSVLGWIKWNKSTSSTTTKEEVNKCVSLIFLRILNDWLDWADLFLYENKCIGMNQVK